MSEVKPIATVCLRGEGYAHGHMLDVQLQIMPDTDLPIGTRLYDERVVAVLRAENERLAKENDLLKSADYFQAGVEQERELIEQRERAKRDEAALAELRAKLEAADADCMEAIKERDWAQDCLRHAHLALGGDGEWTAKIPSEAPPESGDLHLDVPALAKEVLQRAERAEARVAELERQFRENARKAREQAAFEAAGAWDDAATAIEQQLAALQGGEA